MRADIPGTVEGNPVFDYHDVFNPDTEMVDALKARYRAGTVGDGEVKDRLTEALVTFMAPIQERMEHYDNEPGLVDEIILDGTERMRKIAQETMREVRKAMGLDIALKRMRRNVEKRDKKRRKAAEQAAKG